MLQEETKEEDLETWQHPRPSPFNSQGRPEEQLWEGHGKKEEEKLSTDLSREDAPMTSELKRIKLHSEEVLVLCWETATISNHCTM